jgi:hypothetical protein
METGTEKKRKRWPDDYMHDTGPAARGIRCPKCWCARTKVVYTRHSIGGRNMRRRVCGNVNCGHEFTTFEKT